MSDDSDDAVKAAHERWQECHGRLGKFEVLLHAALTEYSAGQGPLPSALMEEVAELRRECNGYFRTLMAAMAQRANRDRAR